MLDYIYFGKRLFVICISFVMGVMFIYFYYDVFNMLVVMSGVNGELLMCYFWLLYGEVDVVFVVNILGYLGYLVDFDMGLVYMGWCYYDL